MFSSSDQGADDNLHASIAESPNNPTSETPIPKQSIKIKLRRKPHTATASYTTQVNADDDTPAVHQICTVAASGVSGAKGSSSLKIAKKTEGASTSRMRTDKVSHSKVNSEVGNVNRSRRSKNVPNPYKNEAFVWSRSDSDFA
jgi:hypothetical protein